MWLVCGVMLLWQPNFTWQDSPREKPYGSDFLQEYVGGRILLTDPDSLYDGETSLAVQKDPAVLGYESTGDGYYPMIYPPWWYAVVSPVSLLPLKWAAKAWLVVLCGVWFLVLRWAAKADAGLGRAMRSCGLLLVAAGPLLTSYAMGQKSVLIASILLASAVLCEKGRLRTAGAVCGLLAFKPHLMLLFAGPLVLRYGPRVMTGGLATLTSLAAVAAVANPTLTGEYLHVVCCSLSADYLDQGGYHLNETHNWAGLWSRLLGVGPDARQATLVWTTATLGLVGCVCLVNRGGSFRASGWGVVTLAAVLCSPHFYSYDLAVLIVPGVLWVRDAGLPKGRAAFVGLLLWFALTMLPQLSKQWPGVPVQWSTVALVGVFSGACWAVIRKPASASQLHRPPGKGRPRTLSLTG